MSEAKGELIKQAFELKNVSSLRCSEVCLIEQTLDLVGKLL